jgi:UDP-N-acetylmuramoyl-L-alanyl-D-glutamate--2,6-diaminopimelate ligase
MLLSQTLVKKLKECPCELTYYGGHKELPPFEYLTLDSRSVEPNTFFIALKGTHINGEDFILDAIKKGATGVATSLKAAEHYAPLYPDVFFIGTDHVRVLVSCLSKIFYPQQPETVVAVTGTNGKTSTADFTRQLWESLKEKSASLGTLGMRSSVYILEKRLTTPEAPYLHQTLQDLETHGITHLAMEASSHGLEQHRLDNVTLKAAGFTNITPEHLDYHKTMAEYLEAKVALFRNVLPSTGVCVLNADIPEFARLAATCKPKTVLSYGKNGNDIRIQSMTPTSHGQKVSLVVFGEAFEINFPLIGAFQLYNALCALGLVLACDESCVKEAVKALESLQSIPGRLEHIASTKSGASVYIDYAHTPDGVENLLTSLRRHTKNHLHIVFGGGGDRDPSTRAPRGALAEKLADFVYICDDNPRTEDPRSIRQQILSACPSAKEIPDREEAIRQAIHSLEAGDILVVAGKGRELGQLVQGEVLPFDDAGVITKIIERMP